MITNTVTVKAKYMNVTCYFLVTGQDAASIIRSELLGRNHYDRHSRSWMAYRLEGSKRIHTTLARKICIEGYDLKIENDKVFRGRDNTPTKDCYFDFRKDTLEKVIK